MDLIIALTERVNKLETDMKTKHDQYFEILANLEQKSTKIRQLYTYVNEIDEDLDELTNHVKSNKKDIKYKTEDLKAWMRDASNKKANLLKDNPLQNLVKKIEKIQEEHEALMKTANQ